MRQKIMFRDGLNRPETIFQKSLVALFKFVQFKKVFRKFQHIWKKSKRNIDISWKISYPTRSVLLVLLRRFEQDLAILGSISD